MKYFKLWIAIISVMTALLCLNGAMAKNVTVFSGECGAEGSNATWKIDSEGVLTISGIGAMRDYALLKKQTTNYSYYEPDTPWYSYWESIREVKIADGITSIGEYAFSYCLYLNGVTISDSVTCIGKGAFKACEGLGSINIPSKVTYIGDEAFMQCGFSSIHLPDTVTYIGMEAFLACVYLTEINIPSEIKNIEPNTFSNCWRLTEISIPNGVTTIGAGAFYRCALESIDLPESVTSIGTISFWNCASLESVCVANTDAEFGINVFGHCSENFILYGKPNSTTETYAKQNGHIFKVICNHNIVEVEAKEATCTEDGHGASTICSICGTAFNGTEIIPALGHTVVMDEEVPATCYASGHTAGSHCSVCNEILEGNEEILQLEHVSITDAYIAPTLTTFGCTAGSHCAVCAAILETQSVIPPLSDDSIVAIPEMVIEIAEETFMGTGVEVVRLPMNCVRIGAKAFAGCVNLKLIEIPALDIEIADDAFDQSNGVVIVTVPDSSAQTFACENHIPCLTEWRHDLSDRAGIRRISEP